MTDSPRRRRVRVEELLLEQKLINEQQLKTALAEQSRTGRRLGRVLTDLGMVTEQAFHEALAKHLQIPFLDLRQVQLAPEAVRLLPEAQARRSRALVLKTDAAGAVVAMADPTDLLAYDEMAAALKRPIRLALVKEADLLETIDTVYRRTDEIASIAHEVGEELRETDVDIERLAAEEGSADAPVIRLIQTVFHDAMQVGASDVHIEPGDSALRVRQRVDGHLQEQVIEGGRRVAGALTTRLKLLSGLDIAEKRLPQDGRFSVKIGGKAIDVRLSTMPTQHGESVVMRLRDQSSSLMSLETLGMAPPMLERFSALIERSAGMVLVTGPTGSGKTTTLYSALQHLNKADTKIITVEDPVEYRLDRVNQVQVNAKIGLDFARVLRTTLRQDPDIVLVGEMRDRETVEIGLRAAITGHLVFSTLHTMSAVATVHRLFDMGAPGYMIAAAVHGIVAQRLLRRVCENCSQPVQADPHQAALLRAKFGPEAAAGSFRSGSGCTYCNLTGYRGRIAVYELLEIDQTLTDAIRRSDLGKLAEAARAHTGFISLARGALDLAVRGITTVSEALGVASGADSSAGAPAIREAADPLLEEALQANATGDNR
ncbi:MAG: type II/IV secretion system protein [Gammaproteobacteria bacterium]|nr:type II/IV secretion system protein [Gammaproteobacteria bacterium]